MSRKICSTCDGCRVTHIPPCFWDPTKRPDCILHNPPPPCGCIQPVCTDCNGTGEQARRPEMQPLIAVSMTLIYAPTNAYVDTFYLMTRAADNLWTLVVAPTTGRISPNSAFEALVRFAAVGPSHLLASGTSWPLFYPQHIGEMRVL